MKQWLKDNKLRLILSSVVTLLPMLYGIVFWEQLPNSFTTHWGIDGVANGSSGKAFVVFGLPIIFLFVNLLCGLCSYFDKNNREKNRKAMGIVFWIMPIMSVLINSIMYKTTTSDEFDFIWLFPLLFGVLFIVIGNYMPKVSQNRTLGIKISWTLSNEENWNKTHRLAGRVWVAGGVVMLVTSVLPLKWSVGVLLVMTIMMIIVPIIYSYSIYRTHKKHGISYAKAPKAKGDKIGIWITSISIPIIFIGVAVLMFTGNIRYEYTEDALRIEATYAETSIVNYADVDMLEYRENFDFGVRNMGFGSAKLSLGNFRNDEFGNYTLYAYTASDSAIVIKSGENVLVITDINSEETLALYETLQEKIK